jgi:hypothetical protein
MARIPPPISAPVELPSGPLATYRTRSLVSCQFNFFHKIPADNVLRRVIFTGARRGCAWKIWRISYEASAAFRGDAGLAAARALHDVVIRPIAEDPYRFTCSGSAREAYVFAKTSRALGVAPNTVVNEVHVVNRLQGAALFQVFDELSKDATIVFGTIKAEDTNSNVEALSWEDTLVQLAQIQRSELRGLTANAKHAQRYGSPTAFQKALMLYKEDIAAFFRDQQIVSSLCVGLDEVLLRYPGDFARDLGAMMGWTYDSASGVIVDVSFHDYYTRQYLDKSAFFIGANGAGKTALCCAIAKDFTIRKRKNVFVHAKGLDPLGSMTRSGDMSSIGAFVFSDAPLMTLMNDVLSDEAVKSLVDVRETCSFPARYHTAVLPARHARIFSANCGLSVTGLPDPGFYFQTYRQPALALLARRDVGAIRRLSDDQQAIVRRVIIFVPQPAQIGVRTRVITSAGAAQYDDELAIQAAYYANRG